MQCHFSRFNAFFVLYEDVQSPPVLVPVARSRQVRFSKTIRIFGFNPFVTRRLSWRTSPKIRQKIMNLKLESTTPILTQGTRSYQRITIVFLLKSSSTCTTKETVVIITLCIFYEIHLKFCLSDISQEFTMFPSEKVFVEIPSITSIDRNSTSNRSYFGLKID